MIPFTDEDLKQLKDWLENDAAKFEVNANRILPSLLARLEAAEALEPYWKYYSPVSSEDEKNYDDAVSTWRKRRGGCS